MNKKEIIGVYHLGFNDELNGVNKEHEYEGIHKTAYKLGKINAFVGDEITKLDYQSEEEILKQILSQKNERSI